MSVWSAILEVKKTQEGLEIEHLKRDFGSQKTQEGLEIERLTRDFPKSKNTRRFGN